MYLKYQERSLNQNESVNLSDENSTKEKNTKTLVLKDKSSKQMLGLENREKILE